MPFVTIPAWQRLPWLRHAFTTRPGGHSTAYGDQELNLGYTLHDDRANVTRNRDQVTLELAGPEATLVTVSQVHKTQIHIAHPGAHGSLGEGDGLITAVPNVVLGVQAADCVPVLLADTRLRVVAAIHAGWRGTAAHIATLAVAKLQTDFKSRTQKT